MLNNDKLHKTQKYSYNKIPSDIIKSMGNINEIMMNSMRQKAKNKSKSHEYKMSGMKEGDSYMMCVCFFRNVGGGGVKMKD